jgi:hypothetical protein
MRKYFVTAFLLFAFTSNAQLLDKTAINIAYRYTGRNVLQAGWNSDLENPLINL